MDNSFISSFEAARYPNMVAVQHGVLRACVEKRVANGSYSAGGTQKGWRSSFPSWQQAMLEQWQSHTYYSYDRRHPPSLYVTTEIT